MSQPAPLPLLSCLSWSGSQVTFYWSLPPGAATCHTTRHLPQRSIRCYTHHAPWQKLSASPLSPSPTAHNRTSVASSDSTSTFPTSVHLSQSRVAALVRADVHISGMTLTSPWWVSLIPTCSTIQSLGCFQGDPLKHKFPFKALQWLRLALVTTPSLPSTAHPACLPDCTFVPPILPAIFPPGQVSDPLNVSLLRLPNPPAAIKCDSASTVCPGVSCSQALLKYCLHWEALLDHSTHLAILYNTLTCCP